MCLEQLGLEGKTEEFPGVSGALGGATPVTEHTALCRQFRGPSWYRQRRKEGRKNPFIVIQDGTGEGYVHPSGVIFFSS